MARSVSRPATHFPFGENWARFAENIDESRIAEAARALRRLLGDTLRGARFLDVGCGSGIHAVAALRLGVKCVSAIDLDPRSVATTRNTLTTHAPSGPWDVSVASALDLDPDKLGRYDVVYSWGVLHHTGRMWDAVRCAASMVDDGGSLAIALYRKTALCAAWRAEKRLYNALPRSQPLLRTAYIGWLRAALALRGETFSTYVDEYRLRRGMDFYRDVHDWLGGWPYESARPEEVHSFLGELGFALDREY